MHFIGKWQIYLTPSGIKICKTTNTFSYFFKTSDLTVNFVAGQEEPVVLTNKISMLMLEKDH